MEQRDYLKSELQSSVEINGPDKDLLRCGAARVDSGSRRGSAE